MPTKTPDLLPKQIRIGPMIFTVSQDKKEYLEYSAKCEDDDRDAYGYMDYKNQRILLDPDQAEDCKRDTLWHEVKHAMWMQTGATERFDEDIEEKVIMTQTTIELDTIQRNPELVRYMAGDAWQLDS